MALSFSIPKFAGSKPGRSRRIFQGEKILSTSSFGREVKPFVPCRRFTACKRSLNVTWKSSIFRQSSSAISRPSSSSFHCYGLWWRHLAVQVGMTRDQGLYNKPSTAVHPGALAAGTLPLVSLCIHVLVQWSDDELYLRSKLVDSNKQSQKRELCLIENIVTQIGNIIL